MSRLRRLALCVLFVLHLLTFPAQHVMAEDAEDPMVRLNFPPNVELSVLIEYVSQRLDLNILYDRQVGTQRITLRAPREVPVSSLPGVLESALRMNGLVMVDDEQDGWKRIVRGDDLQRLARRAEPLEALPEHAPSEILTAIYRLRHVRPERVEPVLRPFLSQPGGNTISLNEQRILILTDYAANMERLSDLVRLADQAPDEVQVRFVPAKHLDAARLAQQVNRLLQAKERVQGGESEHELDISADERTNQLIVIGNPARVTAAVELAGSLDVPLGLETRVYHFEIASPQRVDRLVQELIDPRQRERLYRSSVDAEANLLIVTSTADIHNELEAVKKRLDVAVPQEQSPVRFYKLRNASATEVLAVIRAIEGGRGISELAATEDSGRSPSGSEAEEDQNIGASTETETTAEAKDPPQPQLQLPADPVWRSAGSLRAQTQPSHEAVQTERASVVADPNTNSLIVVADSGTQRIYQQLIEALDKRRPQVLIETTIVTLDTSRGFSLGVEIAGRDTFRVDSRRVDTLTFSSFGISEVTDDGELRLQPGLGFNGAIISPDIADIVLRALATSGRAKVVAAPRVLVNDNATGSIRSENQQPFTSVNAFDTIATTSFGGFVAAGTTITMSPQIAEGDHLHLLFDIELSSFAGSGGGEEGIPSPRQVNNVSSEVTVPDGHTVIVGGVNRHDQTEAVNAVPLLGELPLIKHLFRSQDQSNSESTLFVFIRPIILRDDQFEDLKYLSQRDLDIAGLAPTDNAPVSQPMLLR